MAARGLYLHIDVINIRQGGGLSQLLQAADPQSAGFGRVTVVGSGNCRCAAQGGTKSGTIKCRDARINRFGFPLGITGILM